MNTYYLRIEAVNLDNSVYDTHDISTIRGGSFMVLNAVHQLEFSNGKKLVDIGSAASIGLFKFEAEDDSAADTVLKKTLKELQKSTGEFATFIGTVDPKGKTDEFRKTIQILRATARWQQYQQSTLVLPKESGENKVCTFDGTRPAVKKVQKGPEQRWASLAVIKRREKGVKLRNDLYNKLLKMPDTKFTNDLETLAKREGSLSGKIAFIHFDGNRFGSIRDHQCLSEEMMFKFQDEAEKLRIEALSRILKRATDRKNMSFRTSAPEEAVRLETLMWGGDEIEFVVPAWQALNVVQDFFSQMMDAEPFNKVPLTYSAGVVFCHHDLPILQIRRYARQLCEHAKASKVPNEIDKLNGDAHNCFAFLDMSAFDLVKDDVIRFIKDYHAPAKPDDFILTAKEMDLLKGNLLTIKQHYPKNKIYEIILALKANNISKAHQVEERALALSNRQQKEKLEMAINQILSGDINRWFLISDLLTYVGEDNHE